MNNITIKHINPRTNAETMLTVDKDSFSVTFTLDESFHNGSFSCYDGDLDIRAKDRIIIYNYNGNTLVNEWRCRIASVGEAKAVFIQGKEKWEREIAFTENTAELQDTPCPNLAVTQPLPSVWADSFVKEETQPNGNTSNGWYRDTIDHSGWYRINTETIKVGASTLVREYCVMYPDVTTVTQNYELVNPTVQVEIPYFKRIRHNWILGDVVNDTGSHWRVYKTDGTFVGGGSGDARTILLDAVGAYEIRIYFGTDTSGDYGGRMINTNVVPFKDQYFYAWQIDVVANGEKIPELEDKYYTALECAQKIIRCHKEMTYTDVLLGDTKYKLGETDALNGVVAPDMYYTNGNVYENLLLVGRMANSIPKIRLNTWDTIDFINLSDETEVPQGILSAINGEIKLSTSDGFYGATVSELQNMVANNTSALPTLKDTWRTLKGADYTRFTADSATYQADRPIYQIRDLKVRFKGNSERSLRKYLYEKSQYDTLDKTSDTRVNSALYGLYYNQYNNIIDGFTQVLENVSSTVVIDGQNKYVPAICYILAREYGLAISSDLVKNWYLYCTFQLEYVPVFNARLKQYRPNALQFGDNQLIANQQCNVGCIESVGKSMRNSLLQLGNKTLSYTKFVDVGETLPQINQVAQIGNYKYKLTQITLAFSSTGWDCQMTFTKDFNRISAIQSLATEKRFADVSIGDAIRRSVNVDDFIVFGSGGMDYSTALSQYGQAGFMEVLKTKYMTNRSTYASYNYDKPITTFKFLPQTRTGNNAILQNTPSFTIYEDTKLVLPVQKSAYGNSLMFTAKMIDNYSAGTAIQNISGKFFNVAIPYSDTYGTIKFGRFEMSSQVIEPSYSSNIIDERTRMFPLINTYESGDEGDWNTHSAVQQSNLFIEKDSREELDFAYQVHGITDDENVTIGDALFELNPLIVDADYTVNCYLMNRHYNQNQQDIDVNDVLTELEETNVNFGTLNYVNDDESTTLESVLEGIEHGNDISIAFVATYNIKRIDGIPLQKKKVMIALNLDYNASKNSQMSELRIYFGRRKTPFN